MSAEMKRVVALAFSVLAVASAECAPSKPPESTPAVGTQSSTPGSAPTANAALPNPEQAAQVAAEAWLALMDAGKYGESWTEASTLFRNALDQKAWEKASTGVRAPLGRVESRALKGRMFTKTLPGAPDGEYVVVKFDTSFEHKKSAIETITPMKDADGNWRVSGYFIK